MINWMQLIVCIFIPLAIGFTSGWLTRHESRGPWYAALRKPSFNPPAAVFGPVWTCLYILMGISLYLVMTAEESGRQLLALAAFAVQLVLNFAWSLLFFRYHKVTLAAVDIVLLWVSILVMIMLFYGIRPVAGWLQIPYLAWVTFATVLNLSIRHLNPSQE